MARKGEKTKVASDKSAIVTAVPAACASEKAAVEFLEAMRGWNEQPGCPHCGSVDVYQMKDASTGERSKRFLWRCKDCKKQYTCRIGTVFEDSRIPLQHWCYAFWAACASKKGVSALQIKRQTGVSYKSALFMMHRIRFAMAPTDNGPKLTGIVEADETFIGGKPRFRTPQLGFNPSNYKTRMARKSVVFAAIQRNGQARVRVIPQVTAANLRKAIEENVCKSSRLMTDEHRGYTPIGREFEGGHDTVPHKNLIYAVGDINTNSAEGFFALFKRGIHGTFHHVSGV